MKVKTKTDEIKISAKIIRADGSIEDLGVICEKKSIISKLKAFFNRR